MWYEILPSMGIITGAMALPSVFTYFVHKFVQNGNAFRRNTIEPMNEHLYRRDEEITGSPYVQHGLDAIPDE